MLFQKHVVCTILDVYASIPTKREITNTLDYKNNDFIIF